MHYKERVLTRCVVRLGRGRRSFPPSGPPPGNAAGGGWPSLGLVTKGGDSLCLIMSRYNSL